MNFPALDNAIADYKKQGIATSEVLNNVAKLVEIAIAKQGESIWKTMNELSFVQLGVLTNMVREYVKATY